MNPVTRKFSISYFEGQSLASFLPEDIKFIHTEELLMQYPDLTPKERESKAAEKHGAIFVIGIGGKLANGEKHDGRAPDYDDWSTPTVHGYRGLTPFMIVGSVPALAACALLLVISRRRGRTHPPTETHPAA